MHGWKSEPEPMCDCQTVQRLMLVRTDRLEEEPFVITALYCVATKGIGKGNLILSIYHIVQCIRIIHHHLHTHTQKKR